MPKAKPKGPRPPESIKPTKSLEPWLAGNRPARLLMLAAITALSLLAFTGKAYHIDDPLFVWAGKQIGAKPLDPYGFQVNWYGYALPMSEVTKNPPGACYYIAAAAAVAGFGERAQHLAFLIPAIVVILGTYLLAEKFCSRPLLAALFTLMTPVFLVSSTTVMSDTIMLAWWMAATWLWVTGLETGAPWRLALAGLCVAASALSKYFGMTLIPLLAAYTILKRRRLDATLAYLILPVALLAAYQWGTHRAYGRGLLLDAASYATGAPTQWRKMSPEKILIGLAFTGGCVGVAWMWSLWPFGRKPLLGALAVAAVVALGVGATHAIGSYVLGPHDGVFGMTTTFFGLFVAGGVCLLGAAIAAMAKKADAETFLLGLWILGTFAFATVINWSTNGRSILPMAPAAAIFLMRWIEQRGKGRRPPSMALLQGSLAAAAVLSLSVAWADQGLADSARRAARGIHAKYGARGGTLWFEGHWGFQYYMEALGAKAIDQKASRFLPGDIIVVPENNTNISPPPKEWTRLLETMEFPASLGIATMNYGAGLYSDAFGPLPYAFGPVPKERYAIYEAALQTAK